MLGSKAYHLNSSPFYIPDNFPPTLEPLLIVADADRIRSNLDKMAEPLKQNPFYEDDCTR
jgi:hypothetical protein